MASIILPRRWQQQPTGPVDIDWRNPLTQGMAHCYLGGDSYHVNLVRQAQVGVQTERMGTAARPEGLATSGTGSAYMVDSKNVPTALPLTIGVMAGARTSGGGPVFGSFSVGSVGSAISAIGTGFVGDSYPEYWIDRDSGVAISDKDAQSSLVNTSRAWVCRSLSATDHALIVGRRITTNTTSRNVVVPGALVGLGRYISHNYASGSLGNTAWFHLAVMWYRGLSDAEAFEFNAAPFQVFHPRRQRVYFDVATGGATTLTTDTGSFALTGNSAALTVQRRLSAETGSFALTGNDAILARGYGMPGSVGEFTLTGNDAGLLTTRTVTADAGAFTLTGNDATLTKTTVGAFTLTADAGAFTLTGNDAGLLTTRTVTADAGTFTLTGNDATLTKTTVGAFTLTCDVAAFTVTGTAAELIATRTLPTTTASFALAGVTTGLLTTRSLTAEPGAFAFTGNNAGLVYNPVGSYTLSANTGAFNLTGVVTGLVYTPVNAYTLTADTAAFSLGGVSTGLRAARTIAADAVTFVLTGGTAGLGAARKITADAGTFVVTGSDTTLRGPSRITAETGAFTLTGRSANLSYSGYDPLANEKYTKGVRVYHTVDDVTVRTSASQVRVIHTTPQVRI